MQPLPNTTLTQHSLTFSKLNYVERGWLQLEGRGSDFFLTVFSVQGERHVEETAIDERFYLVDLCVFCSLLTFRRHHFSRQTL